MNVKAEQISSVLGELANPEIAQHSQRFFKTAAGDYGEGDKFLGIRVPAIRKKVRSFAKVPIQEILILLKSSYHEERLFALLVFVDKFSKGDAKEQSEIYRLYLAHTSYINNWDLVDSSASQIVGAFLVGKSTKPLLKLANSASLWERRIAIIATFYFIKLNHYSDTLRISHILRDDPEDLIHKAVGWMLREVGNRDMTEEERYLKHHYKDMPRTMLRYAIEKFPENKRQLYLNGKI
jgi:3-methyladenine DNA glycosylase AlkD